VPSIEIGTEPTTSKSTRRSSLYEMNDFLRMVQSQNRFLKWMQTIKLSHKARRMNSVSLQSLTNRRSTISAHSIQDPFTRTQDLVSSLVSDLKSLDMGVIQQPTLTEKNSTATQTSTTIPIVDEPVAASQNYNALIRETANAFLSQSKRLKEVDADAEQFFKAVATRPWIDAQALNIFTKSIAILQEHLIFEEALRLLREKGVVLENIFSHVYEKFDIFAKDKGQETDNDVIQYEEVSGASFEDKNDCGDQATIADGYGEQVGRFILDFELLVSDSVEAESKTASNQN